MNKYLKLSFKDAGLIITDNKTQGGKITKDKLPYSLNLDNSRNVNDRFIEPITIYQISNVLHKLFGERPVPTFRYNNSTKDEYLFEKAGKSYLKLNTLTDKNGNHIKETFTTNKSVHNAYNPIIHLDWYKVKHTLDNVNKKKCNNAYNTFLDLILQLYGLKPSDINFMDLIKVMNNDDKNKFNVIIDFLTKCERLTLINKQGSITDSSKTPDIKRFINKGIDKISYFSGEIYVPINDDDIKRINNGPGTSTILDGGLVKIEGIVYEEDMYIEDMKIKVSDISTKQLKDINNENKN